MEQKTNENQIKDEELEKVNGGTTVDFEGIVPADSGKDDKTTPLYDLTELKEKYGS